MLHQVLVFFVSLYKKLSFKMVHAWVLPCILSLPMTALATVLPFTEADCSKLEAPKTLLLVHATWCSHCRAFMPVYEATSNEPRYSEWRFYQVVADDLWRICGIVIDRYPVTYKNNLKTALYGNTTQQALRRFLDN